MLLEITIFWSVIDWLPTCQWHFQLSKFIYILTTADTIMTTKSSNVDIAIPSFNSHKVATVCPNVHEICEWTKNARTQTMKHSTMYLILNTI